MLNFEGAGLLASGGVARAHVLYARSARRSWPETKIRRASYFPILALVLAPIFAPEAQAACTQEMAMRSEETVAAIKNWKAFYKSFQAYAVCDDGAIAEGFSDRVEYLMTHRWREMGKFEPLKTDKGFAKFVLRHVDETMSEEGSKQIAENARARCPNGYREFCRLIEAAATHP